MIVVKSSKANKQFVGVQPVSFLSFFVEEHNKVEF